MKTWIAAGVMVLVCATAASAGKYGNLTEHANGKSVAAASSSLVVPVEAYHPNIYHPYYTRTGQILQPLGSCTATYP